MANPDVAILDLIGAAGISGLTKTTATKPPYGGNLIRGPEIATADGAPANGAAVFVVSNGGGQNNRFLGSTTRHEIANVIVSIRSAVQDYAGGQTLSASVYSAIHYATVSGYYLVLCRDAAPLYTGVDDEGRHHWTINVEMRRTV